MWKQPSSISDVKKSAIESVHNEHQQMQSRYIEMERHNVLMRLMSGQYVSREEMEEDCAGRGRARAGVYVCRGAYR